MSASLEQHDQVVVPATSIISCDDVTCEPLIDPIPRPEMESFKVVTTA